MFGTFEIEVIQKGVNGVAAFLQAVIIDYRLWDGRIEK